MEKDALYAVFNELLEKWYTAEIGYDYLPEGEAERLEQERQEFIRRFNETLNK